jgi:hypothetical protein
MPASAHVLVTFGGIFGTGQNAEVWQCGVKMTGKNPDGSIFGGYVKDLTAYVSSVQAALVTWFSGINNLQRSDFTLVWLKAANIKPGTSQNPYGTYNGNNDPNGGPNPAVWNYAGGGTPGGSALGTSTVPQILTVASTFRNKAAPKGPRHSASHGRVYLPMRVSGSSDRLSDTTAYATTTIAMLNTLAKASVAMTIPIVGDATVALRPALVGVNGTINLIDRVEVGDVVDTVRNRKSALRENYYGTDYS